MTQQGGASLDVIMPVWNEGENIRPTLACVFAHTTPLRVLICYDLDDDDTLPAIAACPEEWRERIVLVKNRGRGAHAAIMTGIAHSEAPAVVVYPADDDYNAGLLDKLYARFKNEGLDIVAPSRFMPGGCMEGCRWQKAVLVRCGACALRHLAGMPVHDPSNGFRLFSRRVIDSIAVESDQGFTFSIEYLVKAHRMGLPIGEVPAQWYERKAGTSRFKVFKWLPGYLRWLLYAFATTWFGRKAV